MDERKIYRGEDGRPGEILLRHRWSRIIFFGALAGIVLVILAMPAVWV